MIQMEEQFVRQMEEAQKRQAENARKSPPQVKGAQNPLAQD